MASPDELTIDTQEVAKRLTLTVVVRLRRLRAWRWRVALAGWLIRLAAWVAWVNLDLEIVYPDMGETGG